MEFQPTQPDTQPTQATQPILDPRRAGRNNSGLSDRDLDDVICILHPSSAAAIKVVAHVARVAPQHVLQNDDLDGDSDGAGLDPSRDDRMPRDIALRLSARLKDACTGFRFGRNALTSDIVIGTDYGDKIPHISNTHFRIYLTPDGVLMLQDSSTNGTMVDNKLLRAKPPNPPPPGLRAAAGTSRMLTAGSVIELFCGERPEEGVQRWGEVVKFIVRIPSRYGHEEAYDSRLQQYLDLLMMHHQRKALAIERARLINAGGNTPQNQAALFRGMLSPVTRTGLAPQFPRHPSGSRTRLARAWNGGARYNVIGPAGKGAFATVYKVATKSDGEVFAAKELSRRQFLKNNATDRKFDTEMAIMKQVRHPHIVQYIEHLVEHDNMYIIMEFVPGGDLNTMISERGPLPEPTVKTVARQTLLALDYLHQSKITHRDIKPDNILIVREDPMEIKLSDFGLSKVVHDEETFLKTFCGTLLYCAPEVFSKYPDYLNGESLKRRRDGLANQPRSYSHACDMWSYAAVLFMSLSGRAPYTVETGDRDLMLEQIMTTELNLDPLRRRGVSKEGIDFIRKLLNPEPNLRPTENECFADAWLDDDSIQARMSQSLRALPAPNNDGIVTQNAFSSSPQDEVDLDEQLRADARSSKRPRTTDAFALREQVDVPSSPDVSYPSLPLPGRGEHISDTRAQVEGNRLFGEVGESALGSSGVIPQGYLNLGASLESEGDPSLSEASTMVGVLDHSQQSHEVSSDPPEAPATHDSNGALHEDGQHQSSAAASLLGAESLVGHLNVSSPSPHLSPTSPKSPKRPMTPKSEHASPSASMKHKREDGSLSSDGGKSETPRKRFVRRIDLDIPDSHYYNPWDKSTHNAEYAAMMRARDERASKSGAGGRSLAGKSMSCGKSNEKALKSTVAASNCDPLSRLTTPPSSFESEVKDVAAEIGKVALSKAMLSSKPPPAATTSKQGEEFLRPYPVLGKISSTSNSVIHVNLPLTRRETSWGRGGGNTNVYHNAKEIRVPLYAFGILFWKPGLPDLIDKGVPWTEVPDVSAVIRNKSRRNISINGVKLPYGNYYGRLHTNDLISIPTEKGNGKPIELRCVFHHGASASERPKGGKAFEVEHAEFDSGATRSR